MREEVHSIWPIAGFVDWGSMAMSQIIRRFLRTATVVSRESDLLRKLFETVVARCMKEGIVEAKPGEVDASMIVADAHRRRGVAKVQDLDPTPRRARSPNILLFSMTRPSAGRRRSEPKTISPTDPAARYTAAADKLAVLLFRQLPYRSQACGDHGRRGDDRHSPGRSRRGQDDARPHG